ncbi:MAG: hypothetical protein ACE5OR_16125 [bacterium]
MRKLTEVNRTAYRKSGKEHTLYHLQLKDSWKSDFWLHLEMNGRATLGDLDHFLRAVWLECCGRLSRFSVGGWRGEEILMKMRAEQVFEPGIELTHIYDFGTPSMTLIKEVEARQGKPLTSYPIFLMARNSPPEVYCTECEQPASCLCFECLNELNEPGTLCDQHAEVHPHEDYGEPVPLVNSPRMGLCGYEGPAEPPY